MADIHFEKRVSVLPETLVPNTLYFVKNGQGFDIYFADKDGAQALPLNTGSSSDEGIEPFLLMGVTHA